MIPTYSSKISTAALRLVSSRVTPPFTFANCPSGTPSGNVCRYSDSALFDVDDDFFYDVDFGGIYQTTGRNTFDLTIPPTSGRYYFTIDDGSQRPVGNSPLRPPGSQYEYIGATTGWHSGYKGQSCFTFNLSNVGNRASAPPSPVQSDSLLICQSALRVGTADGGDSGAPVFRMSGNGGQHDENVVLIGILFAEQPNDSGIMETLYSKWVGAVDDHYVNFGEISVQDD